MHRNFKIGKSMKKHNLGRRDSYYEMNLLKVPKFFFKGLITALLFFCITTAFAQQKSVVAGTVVDEGSNPIIGASVTVSGQKVGTVTDINGKFSINVEPNKTLEVTFIGFVSQKVPVKGQKTINIVLREDNQVLNEVIVTGYGAVSKKNLTTSIVKVKADDVPKAANSNMSQMLMGRAAGLQATVSSAQPGGGIDITIRGGGAPIYVVDGVVMPGSSLEANSGGSTTVIPSNVNRSGLAGLNPDDIESIEVLKDASASIYGIGAANGVVLITTKKGKEGKMRVTYDGSLSSVSNYKYIQSLDAKDYMSYVNVFKKEQYLYNNGQGVYGSTAYDGGSSEVFTASQIASAQTTNWRDMILRNGSISNHNVTVQGGSNALQYYLSGNYFNQVGTVENSAMERFTLRSNIASQLTSFLKLTAAINFNKNRNNNGTVGGSSNGRGGQASGSLAAALSYPTNMSIKDADGKYSTFLTIPNPVGMLDIDDVSVSEGYNMNFTMDFEIIKNMLAAKVLYGYNCETSDRSVYIPSNVYYDQVFQSRGSLQKNVRDNSTMEATISFNKSFLDKFTFDAVVGMGRYFNNYNGLGVSYTDINDVIQNYNISAATGSVAQSSYKAADEKRSQFGRFSLDILDRYVISGSLRRDGTDKFFKDKKYAWFPSVSLAWKIFNEKFMKSIEWVNLLKLRASYGVTGNDNLGTTLYGSYGAFGHYVEFDQNSTKYIPFVLNSQDYPNVTWEKTVMKNVGLDFSIFKDRISGSFDYFWNDVTDMLGTANSNGLSMFGTYPINGGHIRRYGWDATINTKNIITKNFRWNSMLTLSHYNAIWKERMPNYDYAEYQVRKDEPVNALYFYRTDGLVNATMSNCPDYQPDGYKKPGCPIIKDLNGDGAITIGDVDMVNVVPDIYLGFGNTFYYKNWDLNVFVYSQLGLKKYNYIYSWCNGTQLANQTLNQSTYIKDAWTSDNQNGNLPGIAYYLSSVSLPGGCGTDVGYQNSSFLRVRNITLGYTFNEKSLGALSKYFNTVRIYADAQNPLTITNFKGFDPEVYTGNNYKAGKAEYPQIRTFSMGVKVSF